MLWYFKNKERQGYFIYVAHFVHKVTSHKQTHSNLQAFTNTTIDQKSVLIEGASVRHWRTDTFLANDDKLKKKNREKKT